MTTADSTTALNNLVMIEVVACDPARIEELTGYAWDDARGYQLGLLDDDSGWVISTAAGKLVGPISDEVLLALTPHHSRGLTDLIERTQREIS